MILNARLMFVLAAAVALALGVIAPASASCQTGYCYYQRAVWELDREQELLEAIEKDPGDQGRVRQLIENLNSKARNERRVARWRESFRFEAEPRLVDDSAEARYSASAQRWQEIYRQGEPEVGGGYCQVSEAVDPVGELERLRRSVAQRPDSAARSGCLQTALSSVGEAAEAEALAEVFLAAHPGDAVAWRNVLAFHRRENPGEREQQLLEARADRLPTLEHRLDLLGFYGRHQLTGQRDALLAVLEAEDLSPNQARSLCWKLDPLRNSGPDSARHACEQRLYHRLAGDASEDSENVRQSLRDTLLTVANHKHDWARIEHLLADWPRHRLVYAWDRLIDRNPEGGCPRLIAVAQEVQRSVAPGSADDPLRSASLDRARRLAVLFGKCSRDDLALTTLSLHLPATARDLDSAWAAIEAVEAHNKLTGAHLTFYDYRRYSGSDSSLTPEERRAVARRWVEKSPALVEPVRQLIAAYGEEELYDEAAKWSWQAADRYPENPDIPLTLGAAALRWQRHDLVREAARIVGASAFANPRHHAEAAYLMGRVARREGRWEEASELLLRYFSLRQRFGACGACDEGLLAHLTEAGDSDRLAAYLELRRDAIAEYEKRHPEPSRRRPNGHARQRQLPDWAAIAGREECVFPATLDYLERFVGAAGPNARARLANKRSAPICPGVETLEVEAAFSDDLLSLAANLTAID